MKSWNEMLKGDESEAAAVRDGAEFRSVLVRRLGESLPDWSARGHAMIKRSCPGQFMAQLWLQSEFQAAYSADPEARQEEEARKAAEQRQQAGAVEAEWRRRVAAKLPKRAAELAFSGYETPSTKMVRQWLESGTDRSLVLRGGVGAGKSTAAALFPKKLLEPTIHQVWNFELGQPRQQAIGYQSGLAVWVRPDQLVSAVLHDYDENSPKLNHGFVLDDMGRETKSDFTEALCAVLDGGKHKMVITTNETKQQMRERYDLRLLDRMNECCVAFDVPGKSLRDQGGNF